MIKPIIEEIAVEYSGRIKVGVVNTDEQSALADQHGISSIPSLFLYNNGVVAAQKTGAALKHEIEALFKDLI
jgi:thioredoxin 1